MTCQLSLGASWSKASSTAAKATSAFFGALPFGVLTSMLALTVSRTEYVSLSAFTLTPSRWPSQPRSEEHTSELQALMRISYAVFRLQKKTPHRISTSNSRIMSQNQQMSNRTQHTH